MIPYHSTSTYNITVNDQRPDAIFLFRRGKKKELAQKIRLLILFFFYFKQADFFLNKPIY